MFPVFHREHARVLFKGTGKVLVGCITHQFRYVLYLVIRCGQQPSGFLHAYLGHIVGKRFSCLGFKQLAQVGGVQEKVISV